VKARKPESGDRQVWTSVQIQRNELGRLVSTFIQKPPVGAFLARGYWGFSLHQAQVASQQRLLLRFYHGSTGSHILTISLWVGADRGCFRTLKPVALVKSF